MIFYYFPIIVLLHLTAANLCPFENLRQYNLDDYNSLLTNAKLILNFEPNRNYLNKNISLECYMNAHLDNGRSCPELFNNESYKNFFLYKLDQKYTNRFGRACQKKYKGCFALENYEYYDRSFFDCHNDQSDIFVYTGSELLVKIEEKHIKNYRSKLTGDAILYKVSPEEILRDKRFLYKVTLTENEMISHDANICHSVIVHQYPIKRIVCLY